MGDNLEKYTNMPRRARDYYFMMIGMLCGMFEYDALGEHGIDKETLLKYAMYAGCAGVAYSEKQDKFVCGVLRWSDVINDNGTAGKCVLTGTHWAEEFATKNVAYYKNGYFQQPENQIRWFAGQFCDTDTAQRALIRHSRYTPMPVASNENERKEYEGAMLRNINGEDITVIVRPQSSEMLQTTSTKAPEDHRILNLTDPTMIEKMHFLSEYHAELKKRFGAMYGMCFKSSSKSAQETRDEIHGMDNFSLIIPFMRLNELKAFADRCQKLWGWAGSETVDFSELWKRENMSAFTESISDAEQIANVPRGTFENAENLEEAAEGGS